MYIGWKMPGHDEHHITLTFNGKNGTRVDQLKSIAAIADAGTWWRQNGNVHVLVYFNKAQCWDTPSGKCWVSPVTSVQLPRLREKLTFELDKRELWWADDFGGDYKPHLTLGYGTREPDNPYLGQLFQIESLTVVQRTLGNMEITI